MRQLTEQDIYASNQIIARAFGFNKPFSKVNIQYKNDYIMGVSFLALSQYNRGSKYGFKKDSEDDSEIIIIDLLKFSESVFLVPGLYEIPDGLNCLCDRLLEFDKRPDIFGPLITQYINHSTVLTEVIGSENSPNHYMIKYTDHMLGRNMMFDGLQDNLNLSKFEALAAYIKYRNHGDRISSYGTSIRLQNPYKSFVIEDENGDPLV